MASYTIVRAVHVIISVLLIAAILIQSRGVGLSSTFGGGGEVFRTKRGVERIVFGFTILLAILFTLTSSANVVFS